MNKVKLLRYYYFLIGLLPFGSGYAECKKAGMFYISYLEYLKYKAFGGRHYYPIPKTCVVAHPKRIQIGCNSHVFRPGCYIQGEGTIRIGNYVQVAQNVGIVSTNHDVYDLSIKHPAPIVIGDYCWLGMGAVILAGVELGSHTIVAAGAVVTKSFPGNCIVGGVPAKIIKYLEADRCIDKHIEHETYGFLSKAEFKKNFK